MILGNLFMREVWSLGTVVVVIVIMIIIENIQPYLIVYRFHSFFTEYLYPSFLPRIPAAFNFFCIDPYSVLFCGALLLLCFITYS